MKVSEATRLRELEDENRKLNQLLAEPTSIRPRWRSWLKENWCRLVSGAGPWSIWSVVAWINAGPAVRRASFGRPLRADAGLRAWLKALDEKYPRFRYQALHPMLKAEGRGLPPGRPPASTAENAHLDMAWITRDWAMVLLFVQNSWSSNQPCDSKRQNVSDGSI